VCKRGSHGENTHGSRPTPTKNQQGGGLDKRLENTLSVVAEPPIWRAMAAATLGRRQTPSALVKSLLSLAIAVLAMLHCYCCDVAGAVPVLHHYYWKLIELNGRL
jgi:hypothetical protein